MAEKNLYLASESLQGRIIVGLRIVLLDLNAQYYRVVKIAYNVKDLLHKKESVTFFHILNYRTIITTL